MFAETSILKKINYKYRNVFIKIISPIIALKESKLIKTYSYFPIKHQPIFIIGAPRTGSTILYQLITNSLDVLYIDNLVDRWHRNFFFGFEKSQKTFGNSAHNCFKSFYGNTSNYGDHAPSECGGFWYRWLPRHKHFIDFNELDDTSKQELYNNITAVTNYYDRPIVFKNLNAGQRMRMIKEIFPEAKFIYVKRELLYTAQSILKAKRKLGIPENQFWSVMPKNVDELKKLPWAEQIVKQVYHLEAQIEKDKHLFKDVLTIDYQDITQNTENIIETVQQFATLKYRSDYLVPLVKGGDSQIIDYQDFKMLQSEIYKLAHG